MIPALKKNYIILIFASIPLLTGCDQVYNHFDESLDKIENLIQESKWEEATTEYNQMIKGYKNTYEWIDFYIEPEELSTLMDLSGDLEGAILEKDRTEANMELVRIKAYLKEIYYQYGQQ